MHFFAREHDLFQVVERSEKAFENKGLSPYLMFRWKTCCYSVFANPILSHSKSVERVEIHFTDSIRSTDFLIRSTESRSTEVRPESVAMNYHSVQESTGIR